MKPPGTSTPTKPIVRYIASPNQSARSGGIDTIVLHYTTAGTMSSTVSWFLKPESRVSAHYIVGRDGEIVQMVRDGAKAWHAGGQNNSSIGIEHVARKGDALTPEQSAASAALCRWLLAEYHLNDGDITAHRFTPAGKKTQTDCPGDLWKTEAELKAWVNANVRESANIPDEPEPTGRAYEPCPVPLPWAPYTLQNRDKGPAVYQLRCALIGLGYLAKLEQGMLVSDVFDDRVEYGVGRFQSDHRLTIDAIVGPLTRAAIEAALTKARAKMNPKTGVTRCVFSMDLEPSQALRAGTLTFFDASGGVVRKEPATSGLPGYQTDKHLWTRGACPVPSVPGQTIHFGDGYILGARGIAGWFFPMSPDPIMRGSIVGRSEIGLHRDANVPGTAGCIGLLLSRADYNEFVAWAQKFGTLPLEVKYT